MLPITQPMLEEVAKLRATLGLRTPDAIHIATALLHGCALMVTNDSAFRRVPDLSVTVLNELVSPKACDLDPFYWSQRTWKLSSLLVQR